MNVITKDPSEIKQMIKNQGLSINAFCNKNHVSQKTMVRILMDGHNPYPSTAKKIADGLGVKIEDLFLLVVLAKSETNNKNKRYKKGNS